MLIRRPVEEVFDAFVRPEQLTRFWLRSAAAPLAPGRTVRWEFLVPGASVDTTVDALERNLQLAVRWSDGTRVRWRFESRPDSASTVEVEQSGYTGTEAEAAEAAIEATQGFTIVLCDLKTLLETGTSHNITRDKALLITEQLEASAQR
ncbi:MAG: SRPBCC domain-containing protein [Polyangiaceae bacterium]|nr:SRPBCC domain-containing protein [Polyangiaceae bacterium]